MHHTGYEENHSYGTKTREWQMDTVILMQKNGDNQIDFNKKNLRQEPALPKIDVTSRKSRFGLVTV